MNYNFYKTSEKDYFEVFTIHFKLDYLRLLINDKSLRQWGCKNVYQGLH